MRRGSALIIAMLIMTAIGSVAFGVGRVLLFEIGSFSMYESSIQAFYAAESGIEEGFLRYRYDMETALPTGESGITNSAQRTNLSDLSLVSNSVDMGMGDGLSLAKQLYDLRMNSGESSYGSETLLSDPGVLADPGSPYYIPRDESKKFKTYEDINLVLKSVGEAVSKPSPLNNARCVLIEMRIVNNSPIPVERKAIFRSSETVLCGRLDGSNTGDVVTIGAKPYVMEAATTLIRLNRLIETTWPDLGVLNGAELYIKPIGNDVTVSFSSVNGRPIFGPYSKIKSNGYYNGVSREIAANIDRQHGTLYDLFDYVVYDAD